jgi:hypothetical protein
MDMDDVGMIESSGGTVAVESRAVNRRNRARRHTLVIA